MNRKKITIVLIILLVVLLITGIVLYIRNNNKKQQEEIYEEADIEGSALSPVDTPEELLEEIRLFYADSPNVIVTFEKEEDECWYYKDSDNNSYYYCFNDPTIKKIVERK